MTDKTPVETEVAASVKPAKKSKKESSKMINIRIAPGNWTRLEKYITEFNANPERSMSKLKYTNAINEAVSEYFQKTKI